MATEEQALYLRDGDGFVGTICTKGAWHPNGQAGGAVLALLGHVVEDVATLTPMSLTRLTVDIVRPVPLGERLHVDTRIVREGKKLQVLDLAVRAGDTECVLARALRLRDEDVSELPRMPVSTTAVDPAAALPRPEECVGVEVESPRAPEFLRMGAELRPIRRSIDGVFGIWVRLRVPVVAGEPVRATSRVTLPMDTVNLIGARLDVRGASAINADVSAHVTRPPVGEWVALTGNTWFAPTVGHGMSVAAMSDELGVFGTTSTSQLVQPR